MQKSDDEILPLPQVFKDEILNYKLYLEMELGKSKNTVVSYLNDVEQFAHFLYSNNFQDFKSVDSAAISKWIALISSDTKATTQSRKLSAVKSLASYLIEEKIWKSDFSALIARPKTRRDIPEVLSQDEVKKLLEEPKNDVFEEIRDRAMLELMYCSGLRVSELCHIKFSDLDFESKIVRVCGKGNKARLIPLGSRAISAISAYKDAFENIFEKKRPIYLFITKRGKEMSRKTFWYNIKKYALRAGIEKPVKPHMLRHCFATHLLAAGANLMAIKEMLGHADLSTTQIYTKVEDSTIIKEHAAHHPRSSFGGGFCP